MKSAAPAMLLCCFVALCLGCAADASRDAGGATPDLAACSPRCAGDRGRVVDCNDVVLAECTPSQVCHDGVVPQCVEACAAAASEGTSVGCEFYVAAPGYIDEYYSSGCLAAMVSNASPRPVQIKLDYRGQSYEASRYAYLPVGLGEALSYQPLPAAGLPPGGAAVVFLADFIGYPGDPRPVRCPRKAAFENAAAGRNSTGRMHAFHLVTSAPVVAYDEWPYGGAVADKTGATLLLPTSAWDTGYLAIDGWSQILGYPTPLPFIQIGAAHDNTQVTIRPTFNIVAGEQVPAVAAGQPWTFTLAAGEVLHIQQFEELNGSAISATAPIAVWGGSGCIDIDAASCCCDTAHQQLPPLRAFGSEYVAVRPRDRVAGTVERVPWRILGAVDGTRLTYDPPVDDPQAPQRIDRGQLATLWSSRAFVVRSQDDAHPFYVSGHMTSASFSDPGNDKGDPEFVNVVPPAQYLARYSFLTDPTMGNTHLVFVRQATGEGNFSPVMLDCKGEVGPWVTVGSYEYARVDLLKDGVPLGICNNGFHKAWSAVPFGLTVWGWDQYVSYAYPAGASLNPLNSVPVVL